MSDITPCPACDVSHHQDKPLFVLAYGVALGSALGMHAVTEAMCEAHRSAYVMSMVRAMIGRAEPEVAT